MSATYAAVYSVMLPKANQVVDPFHLIALANRCSMPSAAGSRPNNSDIAVAKTTPSTRPVGSS